jgi:tRNA (cytidine/uridine-2'-O-)-methyltransferase
MHIVLVAPEIPPNTGNVARLCAATQSALHLVRPFGFVLDDRKLKRAGLDYWEHVELVIHDSLEAFWKDFSPEQCSFVTTKGKQSYTDVAYDDDAVLVFGSEGAGLPEALLNKFPQQTINIPMSGPVRSINLATAVGIVLFEAKRQRGAG